MVIASHFKKESKVEDLGLKISRGRLNMNLSQEKLAELVGVSRQTIINWEQNESKPRFDNYNKLMKTLNSERKQNIFNTDNFKIIDKRKIADKLILIIAETSNDSNNDE